jgi:hypothetical protein
MNQATVTDSGAKIRWVGRLERMRVPDIGTSTVIALGG